MAPPSPAFLEYQQRLQSGLPGGGGVVPSPIDRSLRGAGLRPFLRAASGLPSSFDLRATGRVSPVKDQISCGACWGFATMGNLESAFLPGQAWDFSENHLLNTSGFVPARCDGGNEDMAAAYLTRWSGPVAEADDPFSMDAATSPAGLQPRVHIQRMLELPGRTGPLDNDTWKQAVMELGAIWTYIHWVDYAYQPANAAYYYSGSRFHNHSVLIAGWDDNYPKSNFATPPPGNGAFLIKNSWGTSRDHEGYFWLSYYDVWGGRNLFHIPPGEPVDNYGAIYQHDWLGQTMTAGLGSESGWLANVFTAERDDELAAVGFYTTGAQTAYRVRVYTDVTGAPNSGRLVADVTGTRAFAGYDTLRIEPVAVAQGSRFAVVVYVSSPGMRWPLSIEAPVANYAEPTSAAGQSFYSTDGQSWRDLTLKFANGNACIKAYTRSPDATALALEPAGGAVGQSITLGATLTNLATQQCISGAPVAFALAGSSLGGATTDASGRAALPYTLTELLTVGETPLTATYAGATLLRGSSDHAMLAVLAADVGMACAGGVVQAGSAITLGAGLSRSTDGAPLSARSLAFMLGGKAVGAATTDAEGKASLAYTVPASAPAGSYTVVAAFAGDAHHNAGSASASVTITSPKAATTCTVPNRSNVGAGASVPLGAFLKVTATGAALGGSPVTFSVDGTRVGSKYTDKNGIALLYWTTPAGFTGAHPVDAAYAGTSVYDASAGRGWINPGAGAAPAATAVTATPVTAAAGASVTLAGLLARASDGAALAGRILRFAASGSDVGAATTAADGRAELAYTLPAAATSATYQAAFAGDAGYAASSGSARLAAIGAPTATPGSGSAMSGKAIPVTLAGVDPQGLPLTFAVATQPTNGTLSGTAPNLTFTPAAGWLGDDAFTFTVSNGYLTSAPATVALRSGGVGTQTSVTGATGEVGQVVRFTARTTDAAGAPLAGLAITMTTPDGAIHAATTDAAGATSLAWEIPARCRGGAVTAAFTGDAVHEPSAGSGTLTVIVTTHLALEAAGGAPGATVAFAATLREGVGTSGIEGKALALRIDGGAAIPFDGPTAAGTGKAACSYTIPAAMAAGAHTAAATFAGDADWPAAGASSTLTVVAGSKPTYVWLYIYAGKVGVSSKSVSYLYEVTPRGSLIGIPGRTLRFTAAGTQIASAVTASDGKAILTYIPTTAGTFAAKALFDGDGTYTANSASGTLTVSP